MRICHFTSTFLPKIGGAEFAIHYLAENLSRLKQEITVLCPIPIKKKYITNYKIRKIWQLPHFSSILGKGYGSAKLSNYDVLTELSYSVNLLFKNLTKNFNLIHAHFLYPCGFVSTQIKKISKIPIVCTIHGADLQIIPELNYGIRLNQKINAKIMKAIEKIDALISLNPSIKKELIKCGADKRKIFEIANGVDIRKFVYAPEIDIKKKYQIKETKKIILSIGRNHPVKGYVNFLRVLPEILNENNDFIYIIIGRDSTNLLPLVRKLGIHNNVRLFEGIFGAELINFYRKADIFLSPSLIEGLALVYLEALAAGLPIIATNLPAISNVVINEKNGLTVPTGNYSEFIEPILKLLTDEKKREFMGNNSRKLSENYDWKIIAKKHLQLYQRLK